MENKEQMIAELMESINSVKNEMEAAKTNFNCVSKPDEVDICIYNLRAAETHYCSLLKKLKEIS